MCNLSAEPGHLTRHSCGDADIPVGLIKIARRHCHVFLLGQRFPNTEPPPVPRSERALVLVLQSQSEIRVLARRSEKSRGGVYYLVIAGFCFRFARVGPLTWSKSFERVG